MTGRRGTGCFGAGTGSASGCSWFYLLVFVGIWRLRYIFHEEDSLQSDDAPSAASEISLHSDKKVLSPFPLDRKRRQSLVYAVPGIILSAPSGAVAMVSLS